MLKTTNDELPKARDNLWIYFLSIVPATSVALFSSYGVLSDHPFLHRYTLILKNIVPSVDRLAAVSSFPEITRLVLSIEWTLLPFQVCFFILNGSYVIRVEEWQERKCFRLFCLTILSSVFLWSAIFMYEITPEDLKGNMLNEVLLRDLSTSQLWLGVISSVFMSGIALMIGLLLVWARHIPQIYFGQEERAEL